MNALKELGAYLAKTSARCGVSRWFGAKVHVDVARDILEDVHAEKAQAAALAYRARIADDEAAALIEKAIADGELTPCDMPALQRALAHVRKSAAHDHDLSEALS